MFDLVRAQGNEMTRLGVYIRLKRRVPGVHAAYYFEEKSMPRKIDVVSIII